MYNLEIDKLISEIKAKNAKKVLIQLPDGLKPRAQEITEAAEKETEAQVVIWLSSCYGGCDIPIGVNALGIDLVVQYGHNIFHKEEW